MNTLKLSLLEFCTQAVKDDTFQHEYDMLENDWTAIPVHGMRLQYTKANMIMYVYSDMIVVTCDDILLFKVVK